MAKTHASRLRISALSPGPSVSGSGDSTAPHDHRLHRPSPLDRPRRARRGARRGAAVVDLSADLPGWSRARPGGTHRRHRVGRRAHVPRLRCREPRQRHARDRGARGRGARRVLRAAVRGGGAAGRLARALRQGLERPRTAPAVCRSPGDDRRGPGAAWRSQPVTRHCNRERRGRASPASSHDQFPFLECACGPRGRGDEARNRPPPRGQSGRWRSRAPPR